LRWHEPPIVGLFELAKSRDNQAALFSGVHLCDLRYDFFVYFSVYNRSMLVNRFVYRFLLFLGKFGLDDFLDGAAYGRRERKDGG
jgi:hypothetical protein